MLLLFCKDLTPPLRVAPRVKNIFCDSQQRGVRPAFKHLPLTVILSGLVFRMAMARAIWSLEGIMPVGSGEALSAIEVGVECVREWGTRPPPMTEK
jgi:hypothetical protein